MEKRDLYDIDRNLTGETIFKEDSIPDGKYATTGGHPKSGENSIQGIITEVEEELSLELAPQDIKLYYSGRSDEEKVFWDDYYIKMDIPNIENLVLQKSEVESVCWLSTNEIKTLMKEQKFYANNYEEFERLLEWLDKKC